MLIRQYRAVLRHSFLMSAVRTNPFRHRSLTRLCRSAAGAGAALAMAGGAVAAGPATTALVLDGTKTNTTIISAGGTYDVTTGTITDNNAINAFTQFDVATANTVNLHLPSGTTNLINLVNDTKASQIYGIVNSLTAAGKIGGNVYFLNPNGMIIGATGVFNVGSLTIQAPVQSVLDGFFGASQADNVTAVLEGKVPIGKTGVITVNGKINAMNLVSLQANTVTLGGASIFAGEVARAEFAKIANVASLVPGTAFAVTDGAISIVAINSGSGTAAVSIDASTLHADKAISVQASSTSTNIYAGNETATIAVTGHSQLISGGALSLSATSAVSATVEGSTAADLSPDEQAASDDANSDVWSILGSPLGSPIVEVNLQSTNASVSVEAGSVLQAVGDLAVASSASFDISFKLQNLVAGVAWGDGSATSAISIDGNLQGGSIEVTSSTTGTVDVSTANIKNGLITSADMSFDVMAGVALTNYQNSINIGPNAVLTALTPIADDPTTGAVANLTIKAVTDADESLDVSAAGEKEVAGIAVGVALRTANTSVNIAGTLSGDTVEVGSEFTGSDEIGVDSAQGAQFYDPIINPILHQNTDKIGTAASFTENAGDSATKEIGEHSNDTPNAFSEAMASLKEKAAACGAIAYHQSDTSTTVSVSGHITAGRELAVTAAATETGLRRNVSADVGEDKSVGLGVAVVIDNRDNIVDVVIESAGVLTAGDAITVSADYEQPYQQTWTDNFTDLWTSGNSVSKTLLTETLPNLLSCDFGLSDGLFTSGARTAAEGESFAAAASVNVALANNQATARVADGAHLTTTAGVDSSITISSKVDAEAVNFSGDWGVPLATINPKTFDAGFWFHGTESGDAGVGASYLGIFNTNTALALVGNATISTGSLGVTATNTGLAVDIGVAGGKAGGFGFDGIVATNFYNNTTIAQISDAAVISVSGPVALSATDSFTLVAPQGGICVGNSIGLGISVGYTQFTRTTAADIGYLDGVSLASAQAVLATLDPSWNLATAPAASPMSWQLPGGLSLSAVNSGTFINAALAGAVINNPAPEKPGASTDSVAAAGPVGSGVPRTMLVDYDPYSDIPEPKADLGLDNTDDKLPSEAADASKEAESKLGVGISGGAAVCIFNTTAEALVRGNLNLNASGADISLAAKNDDLLITVGGGMTIATKETVAGIAGSFVYAQSSQNAKASLEVLGQTHADNLSVNAERSGLVVSVAASLDVAAGTQTVGAAASGAYNDDSGTTQASIKNGTLAITSAVDVTAVDNATIASATGALTAGENTVGVGGAFSWNQTNNQTLALIEQVTQLTSGSLNLLANNNSVLYAPSAAGAVAMNDSGVGLAGAFSVNLVNDEAHARIISDSGSSIINTGSLAIQAIDGADGTNSTGNPWTQTADVTAATNAAYSQVSKDSAGVSDGQGNTQVTYTTNPDRKAGAAATTQEYSFANVAPTANDKIVAVNLGFGIGSDAGFSLAGAYNQVTGSTTAELTNNVQLNVTGGLAGIEATSFGNIIAIGASASAAGKAAGAASVGVNLVSTSTEVALTNGVVVNLAGAHSNQLIVSSENSTNLLAIDVAGAGSGKGAGIATFAYNQFEGDSLITLTNARIASSVGVADQPLNVSSSAVNSGAITAVVAGGSGSGSGAAAASASVNRIAADTLISLTNTNLPANNLSQDTKAGVKTNLFSTESSRDILSVAVAGSISGTGSAAAAVSYNQLGGQNGVVLNTVDLDLNFRGNDALHSTVSVTDNNSGQAIVVGGSGGGDGAGAASVAINTVGNIAMSPDTSACEQQLGDSLGAGITASFNDHIVGVQATQLTSPASLAVNVVGTNDWVSVAVGGAGAGDIAGGLAGSYNNIGGTQEVAFTNSALNNANRFSVGNSSAGDVIAVGAGISGSGSVAIGASVLINNFYTITKDTFNNTQIDVVQDTPIEASNSCQVVSVSVGGAVSGSVSVGVTGMANKLTNQVGVDLTNGSSITSNGSVLLSAEQTNAITAVAVGGSGAGAVAVAGAVGVNLSNSTTEITVDNSSIVAQGNVALNSSISEDILSIAVGASGAGSVSVGGTVTSNVLGLTNSITVSNNSDLQAGGSNASYATADGRNGVLLQATTDETLEVITINAGASGSVAIQGAVGVNQISSDTDIVVTSSTLGTNRPGGDVVLRALDISSADIYAVSAAAALDAGAGAGVGVNTFAQTVAATLTNANINSRHDLLIDAQRQQTANSTIVGAGAGIAGVGGSVGYGYFGGSSLVDITGGQLNSQADMAITGEAVITINGTVGGGAGGVAGLAAGVQVVSVVGDTEVKVTGNARLSAQQNLTLAASSVVKETALVISAGAGYIGASGAINIIGLTDSVTVLSDTNAQLTTGGNLALSATGALTVNDTVGGGAAGVGAIGASLDLITVQTSTQVDQYGQSESNQAASYTSTNTRNIDSTVVSGNVGAVTIGGAVIVASFGPNQSPTAAPSIANYDKSASLLTSQTANVNQVLGNLQTQQLAKLSADGELTAAEAAQVSAHLNTNWATNESAAQSSSVSLLGNISAQSAVTVNASTVTAYTLLPVMAGAGGASVGASVAYATDSDSTAVSLGGHINASGIIVNALDDANEAFVLGAGTAGGVSVSAAYGQITDDATVTVTVDKAAKLNAQDGQLSLTANSNQAISDQAVLAVIGAIGGEGTGIEIDSNRVAEVNIMDTAKLNANGLSVLASTNYFQNDPSCLTNANVLLPGISLGGATVSLSNAKLSNQAVVTVGQSVSLFGNQALTLQALNTFQAYDSLSLIGGGLITAVDAANTLTLALLQQVTVGNSSILQSNGDIALAANALGTAYTKAVGNCGSLGGAAVSAATIEGSISNVVTIAQGAALTAQGDINVVAGCDQNQVDDAVSLSTESRSFAYGVAVVPATTASTTISQENTIVVSAGASLQSVGDISLLAGLLGPSMSAYYSAKWNGIGSNQQATTLDDNGGREGVTLSSSLVVNGQVASGIQDQRLLHIDSTGAVTYTDGSANAVSQPWAAPQYTYQANVSMALVMDARIAQLQADIQTYAGQAAVVASYQADLNAANALKAQYAGTTTNLYTLSPLTLGLHDVHLGAASLAGTGSISASGGAKVSVLNESTAQLCIGNGAVGAPGILIDDSKGFVYFNSIPVTSLKGFTGTLASVKAGGAPSVVLTNNNSTRPLLQVSGDITNAYGPISLTSTGTVYVQGSNLRGQSVVISAGGDFIQSYKSGFDNIGGEPVTGGIGGSVISAGSIFIAAEKLNINGTLRSGTDNVAVAITSADAAAASKLSGNSDQEIRQITADGNYVADLKFNPALNSFSITNILLGGGYVELFGDIFSTGSGNIQVFDGSGTISITNPNNYDLRLSGLDTGNVKGIVRITDTSKPQGAQYVTTEFTRTNGVVTQTSYVMNGAARSVLGTSNVSLYQPTQNRQLHWVNATVNQVTTLTQQASKGGETWGPSVVPPAKEISYQQLANGGYWLDENASANSTYAVLGPQSNVVNGPVQSQKVNGKTQQQWNTTYLQTTYQHTTQKADMPITISFFGNSSGAVAVTANANILLGGDINAHGGSVVLNGQTIVQPGQGSITAGTVNLTGRSVGQHSNPILVNASQGISSSAVNGVYLNSSIGDMPINTIASQGTVELTSAGSIIGVGGHSAAYTTSLPATPGSSQLLSVQFAQTPNISGQVITLAANGSITGDANGALCLQNLGSASGGTILLTASAGTGDINLSVPLGKNVGTTAGAITPLTLSVNTITAANGDVTVFAPGANLIDGNNDITVDPLSQDELTAMWGGAGLTQVTPQVQADRQQALVNCLTREYFQTWALVNNNRAGYNPNYTFTFSAALVTTLTNMGFTQAAIAAEQTRKTSLYNSLLNPQAPAYNPNYVYVLTAAQIKAIATPNWNTSGLINSAPMSLASALGIAAGHGVGVQEGANITGSVVSITGASIGSTLGQISLPASMQWSAMSADQQMKVRMASSGDITSNGAGGVYITYGNDFNVLASDYLTLTATGPVRLASVESLLCSNVSLLGGAIITSHKDLDLASGEIDGDISLYAWNTLSIYKGISIPFGNGWVNAAGVDGFTIYTTPEGNSPMSRLLFGKLATGAKAAPPHAGTLSAGLNSKVAELIEKLGHGMSMSQLRYMITNLEALAGLDFRMKAKATEKEAIPSLLENTVDEPLIIGRRYSF